MRWRVRSTRPLEHEQNREASATGHSAAETYGDRGTRAWSGEAGVLVGGSPTILKSRSGRGRRALRARGRRARRLWRRRRWRRRVSDGGGGRRRRGRPTRLEDRRHAPARGVPGGRSGRRLTVGRAGAEAGRDYSPRCVSDRHQTVTANHGASQPTYVCGCSLTALAACLCLVRLARSVRPCPAPAPPDSHI